MRREEFWRAVEGYPFLSETLERHAAEAPHRVAIADEHGELLTYGELSAAVRAGATWLESQGVRHGDRIVIALPNSIDYAVAYLAAAFAGIVVVAMSARESADDVRRASDQTDAKLAIVQGGPRGARMRTGLADLAGRARIVVAGEADGALQWPEARALAARSAESTPRARRGSDLDFVVFSSGTTGRPKGIAHTLAGAAASVWEWVSTLGLTWRDGVLAPATFGHVGGLQWGLRTAIAAGSRLAVMDRWDPEKATELIERHDLTYTLVTPTYIADLAALSPTARARTQGFRLWAVGGSRMSPDFVRRAEAALGGQVLRGFGMSETFMLTITRPDDPEEARLSCDGRALAGCRMEIRDEQGEPLPPGVAGELYVRSVSLVDGYFTDAQQTAEAFERGWFRTGDIATLSREGYLTITDRKKEIVIRGGENISPQEVEQALAGFAELPAFAVTGVVDDRLGERVAFVHEGDRELALIELHRLLSQTSLAKYKWPEVSILVSALPRTALGKVQRGELRVLAGRARLSNGTLGERSVSASPGDSVSV